jgi:ATP-dependent Clp protease ATP-binding subunit ClpB
MTSNVGSQYLLDAVTPEGELKPDAHDLVMAELRTRFRPEFLNRVDDVVLFKPLLPSEIEQIVDLMLDDVRQRLQERRISLDVTAQARHFFAERGFDPVYGARPLRRFIARELETRIGRALLGGTVPDGSTVTVDLRDGQLEVRHSGAAEATA